MGETCKKYFSISLSYAIVLNNRVIQYHLGGQSDETYQDFKYADPAEYDEEGRLRRVPDFLPVCMQDFLHGREPELREQ